MNTLPALPRHEAQSWVPATNTVQPQNNDETNNYPVTINWDAIPKIDSSGQKTLSPEGATPEYFTAPLPRNNWVDSLAADNYRPMKTPSEHTAVHVKAQVKKQWGVDVDPEKTFLVTIAYDRTKRPYKGVILQKISLADAARLNSQGTPLPSRMPQRGNPSLGDNPIEILPTSQHSQKPGPDGTFPLPDVGVFSAHHQAIYTEPSPSEPNTYSAANQTPIPPKEFQKMVWNHAYKKPYDEYLNHYWAHNDTRSSYSLLGKISYLKAAHTQHHEQSLDEEGRKIAMRLSGIPSNQTYMDVDAQTLKKPYIPDPGLETKFLTFNGFKSTDIFYTRDTTTQKTLLYIPGNSSPIHTFDSPESMNEWLGNQLTDKAKAEEFKTHFLPRDQPSSYFYAGMDARIDVLQKRMANQGTNEHYKEQGYWKEGGLFDGEKIEGDPFKAVQQRVETAVKASTSQQFVLNTDITKKTVLKATNVLSYALLFLAPLGMAFPPVGVLMSALSTATGLVKLGIGIDDKVQDRPGGADRITFGLWNAATPVLTSGFGKALEPVTQPFKTFLQPLIFKN
ncbi:MULTISPECIES: dermonecrotic toxin domain-containing protein [unclassified Pseudomonas]|uniref:dermonecrotic toxin domain-containing protein n=1 Tax=unclassified Pseudomonas TaxID=196821 RepID=UPI0015A40182|nr:MULTISPECIES: DUF6543 domain-containing protein [unclassified Pseudomonas]NWC94319.1 hypothetical protein [Pseudomonas sp. IPO3779]NWD18880.1 hypothetical protein [Pseudomonas sp. IPO3778]